MVEGGEIAASVASELRTIPGWEDCASHRSGEPTVEVPDGVELDDALLELQPPPGLEEVPVWVKFEHGVADLSEVEFEPSAVAIVRWGKDYRERGLVAGFPQMLLGPALAGQRRRRAVAGGRRADGSLELWIEANGTGEVLATLDAEACLGEVADLRWRTAGETGRLLIALVATSTGRSIGLARAPIDPNEPIDALELLLHAGLTDVESDPTLLTHSSEAARSRSSRERWREFLRQR